MVALDFQGKSVAFSGDSRTYGYNASTLGNRWSSLISAERNGQENNLGHPGQYMQSANGNNAVDYTTIPQKVQNGGAKYIFVNYGTNDSKDPDTTTFTRDAFKIRYRAMLEYLNGTKGWDYASIILTTINYFPLMDTNGIRARVIDYNAAVRELALEKNTIFLDPFTYTDGLSNKVALFDTDGIHELDAGHRVDANFFEAADYTPINGFPVVPDPIQSLLVTHGNFIAA